MSTSNKNLVNGTVNLDCLFGHALCISEDGEMIYRVDYKDADRDKEPVSIETEDFLRAVGFTIDNIYDEEVAHGILAYLFIFIDKIKLSHLRSIIKALDAAIVDPDSVIGLYGMPPSRCPSNS